LPEIIERIERLQRINVKKFWEIDDGDPDHPVGLWIDGCGCV
jgi:hypothetical protein